MNNKTNLAHGYGYVGQYYNFILFSKENNGRSTDCSSTNSIISKAQTVGWTCKHSRQYKLC